MLMKVLTRLANSWNRICSRHNLLDFGPLAPLRLRARLALLDLHDRQREDLQHQVRELLVLPRTRRLDLPELQEKLVDAVYPIHQDEDFVLGLLLPDYEAVLRLLAAVELTLLLQHPGRPLPAADPLLQQARVLPDDLQDEHGQRQLVHEGADDGQADLDEVDELDFDVGELRVEAPQERRHEQLRLQVVLEDAPAVREGLVGGDALEVRVHEDHAQEVDQLDLHDVVLVVDGVREGLQHGAEQELRAAEELLLAVDLLDEQLQELAAGRVDLRVLLPELLGQLLAREAAQVAQSQRLQQLQVGGGLQRLELLELRRTSCLWKNCCCLSQSALLTPTFDM